MKWQVWEAGTDDVERLSLVGSATFLETFAGLLDGADIVAHCQREHAAGTYRHYLDAGAAAWLAEAETGAAPVGYALLAAPDLPGSDPAGDLELKRIYALSRFHGTGIGAELMRQAIARAKAEQARRLLLGVFVGSDRAVAFYGKSGFTRIAQRRFRVGDRDYDDVVLAKSLT